MRKFKDHECLLRPEEHIVKHFIDTGVFINFRRRLRSWCMISNSHPLTSKFFKSTSACRNEEIRHLSHDYYMVHPFSMLNLYWEFYMFCIFSATFLLISLSASYNIIKGEQLYKIRFIVDWLQLADVIKLFFTGYYDHEKSKVILNCSRVTKRYLRTFFLIDIVSSIYSYIFPLRALNIIKIPLGVNLFLRCSTRLKILRLRRCLRILELFRQYMGYSSYLFKGISVVYSFLILMLWIVSINLSLEIIAMSYISGHGHGQGGHHHYGIIENYYDTALMLFMVSFGSEEITSILDYVSVIFSLCCGLGLELFLYTQILQGWKKYTSKGDKRESLQNQFKQYAKYKELPVKLRSRIFSYFQFKFHRQYFNESHIHRIISPLLKQEILLNDARNLIQKVDIFKFLPENILLKVVSHIRTEIFMPDDVIISAGTTGSTMYFIYHGTAAVFTSTGKEICHLEDGDHFGEVALILDETRVLTVIAVTISQLFILTKSDFLSVIEPYPDFKQQLVAIATERLHKAILWSNGK